LKLKPRLATLLVTAVGVTALFALTSSPALATVHWNVSSTLAHWKGTLTVKAEGSSVTCSNVDMRVPTLNNEKFGFAEFNTVPSGGPIKISCAGGTTMAFVHEGQGSVTEGKYALFMWPVTGYWLESPFGEYFANPMFTSKGSITNGSGMTSSQLTFSEAVVGEMEPSGAPLTISGTLTITTSTGGLLTLSP
jgi:hypothetical protein